MILQMIFYYFRYVARLSQKSVKKSDEFRWLKLATALHDEGVFAGVMATADAGFWNTSICNAAMPYASNKSRLQVVKRITVIPA